MTLNSAVGKLTLTVVRPQYTRWLCARWSLNASPHFAMVSKQGLRTLSGGCARYRVVLCIPVS